MSETITTAAELDALPRWLSKQAIATYPTRAIATDCLPMEQR